MHPTLATLLLCALPSALVAQSWSITAVVPSPGTATGTITTNFAPQVVVTTPLPPGPAPAGTFFTPTVALGNAHADGAASWSPTFADLVAPVGFEAIAHGAAAASWPAGPNQGSSRMQMDADLVLMLVPPQPVGGRLVLRWRGVNVDFPVARIDVDIGDDGTIDLAASSQWFAWTDPWRSFELPLTIGANGLPIRLRYRCDIVAAALGSSADHNATTMTVTCQFFPHQAVIGSFDDTDATASLWSSHWLDDTASLSLRHQGQPVPGLIAFGAQPLVVPVPGLPFVTQLVQIDTFVIGTDLAFLMPQLPPGTAIFAQGLAIDPAGELRSSNSVRALWP